MEKTEELLMVWPGSNASPADMQAVEDAMNEIIGEKVDAKVKLQIIEWGAYNDQTNLMLRAVKTGYGISDVQYS